MFKTRNTFIFSVVLIALCLFVLANYSKDPSEKRILNLKILADGTFRDNPGWKYIIEHVTREAAYEFNRQLGIVLKVKIIEELDATCYFSPSIDKEIKEIETIKAHLPLFNKELNDRLYDLSFYKSEQELIWLKKHVDFDDCDIVVFFSSNEYGIVTGSVDEIYGKWALVAYGAEKENSLSRVLRTFIHEIGHSFGAVHVNSRDSVMSQGWSESRGLTFDKFNKKRILKYARENLKKQPKQE